MTTWLFADGVKAETVEAVLGALLFGNQRFREIHDKLAETRGFSPLEGLREEIAFHSESAWSGREFRHRADAFAHFGIDGLGGGRSPLRSELYRSGEVERIKLFDAFREARFAAWVATGHEGGWGLRAVHPSREERDVVALISNWFPMGDKQPGYTGWVVEIEGVDVLAFAQPLGPKAVQELEDSLAADAWGTDDFDEIAYISDVLTTFFNRRWRVLGEGVERTFVPGGSWTAERLEEVRAGLRERAAERMWKSGKNEVTFPTAVAQLGVESEELRAALEQIRDEWLERRFWGRSAPKNRSLRRLVPVDGTLAALTETEPFDEPELHSRSVAGLGLEDEVRDKAGLGELATVGMALKWAKEHAKDDAADEIVEGFNTLKRRMAWRNLYVKWTALLPEADAGWLLRYSAILEALVELFPGDVFDKELSELQWTRRGTCRKVEKLLDGDDEFPAAIGDMPRNGKWLTDAPGIGAATVEDMLGALEHYMIAFDAPVERAQQPRASLDEGLDALAKLLGDA